VKAKSKQAFDLESFLTTVEGGKTLAKYRKGETVFAQGDSCDGVFYVQSGDCKVSVISEQGKEAVVALHGKGDFFGEGCLTGQPRRLASVTAMSDLELMRFDNAAIQRVLHEEPDFSEFFISYLLARNARVEADLVDQLFNSSEKRLARTLLLLAHFGKESRAETVVPRVSQDNLAQMVGTTRSRVSHFMNKFRELGFINYGSNGGLTVHSGLLSVVLHDDAERQ
jgi:CRP/FNR family transcriptional regulator, cyclic AMP receptor protein